MLWASLVAQLVKNPSAWRRLWFNSWFRKILWRRDRLSTPVFLGFLVAQLLKNLPAMWETSVGKIPWRMAWPPTQVFLPGESHGQRSLAGYSSWSGRVRHDWATKHSTWEFMLKVNFFQKVHDRFFFFFFPIWWNFLFSQLILSELRIKNLISLLLRYLSQNSTIVSNSIVRRKQLSIFVFISLSIEQNISLLVCMCVLGATSSLYVVLHMI